jgi:CHAT domain-containing protein
MRMRCFRALRPAIAIAMVLATAGGAAPQPRTRVSLQDSFRIGDAGVLCTAQRLSEDAAYQSLFDRAYDVVCRDAASPVGKLYALRPGREAPGTPAADQADCPPPTETEEAGLGAIRRRECAGSGDGARSVWLSLTRGGTTYAARGFVAYEAALRLGLESLARDRTMAGTIDAVSIGATDAEALTRLQAERLDPDQALAAAYKLANSGGYADAADFFDNLIVRARSNPQAAQRLGEYLANQAIEQSTLGNLSEADRLFAQAEQAIALAGPNGERLMRNLKAMHRLNQRDGAGALAILDRPGKKADVTAAFPTARVAQGYVDQPLSQRLSLDSDQSARFLGVSQRLTDAERETLLEAQTVYLRGVALRLTNKADAAARALDESWTLYLSVRGGRVRSMAWLAAGIASERADLADARHDNAAAEAQLQQAATILATSYPDTAALLAAQAKLAAYQARHGRTDQAIGSFRQIAEQAPRISGGSEALRPQIGAYFDALLSRASDKDIQADFFAATQVLVRPGVAQTQAVLARELSGGSNEAAQLFRQSINMSRELVILDTQIAWLSAQEVRTPVDETTLANATQHRKQLTSAQTEVLAKLAAFPKFRVIDNGVLALADLQKALRPDEAYFKVVTLDRAAFAMLIRPQDAAIYRLSASTAELETLTDMVRDSIATVSGNQLVTNPFDAVAARKLFLAVMGPVAGQLTSIRHVVFEPDGALLKLPATILITDQHGVDAYLDRQKQPDADAFDMRGIAWLGRDRIVSTAVSPRSFIDVRAIAPSKVPFRYLGMGQNAPPQGSATASEPAQHDGCDWPASTWARPVSADELTLGNRMLGGAGNQVITGAAFTDDAVRARGDLANFRILQFATHGLVTAPHPGCPARPALVTSFGSKDSDGLLSFKEIFDLRLDADTVLLSACDTAGAATAAATREAGISTGGNFALDGLVRAFVGAGARSVVASHWPVPDDFNATRRLMSELYRNSTSEPIGEALRRSQSALMDDPVTSHPYYWAAFVILGDASKPMTTQ